MKPQTVICDIDGCIFKHHGAGPSHQWWDRQPELLPGVLEQFEYWESQSAYIILMTARPECNRTYLEEQLTYYKLFWHQLIMGVSHGSRLLINDTKPSGHPSAGALNVTRNQGLTDESLRSSWW